MTNRDKLHLLEEALELEYGVLNEEICLDDLDEWDSLGKISFMSMVDERFNKVVKVSEIRKCEKVGDLLRIME